VTVGVTRPAVDRRRKGFGPGVARLTYPARNAFDDLLQGFPCNLIGHSWVEVPQTLRRSARNQSAERMRFQCRRCSVLGGFSS